MARSKSSKRWLREHFDDPYVQEAQRAGYRSRAAFKLLELQEKHRVVQGDDVIVDLGAAPGGWSQLAARWAGPRGLVVALDLLPMDPLPGVTVLAGDFTEEEPLAALTEALGGRPVDVVLSDMAPNISGMAAVDQPRAMLLAELALDFAVTHLKPGGRLVSKVFQGEGFDAFVVAARQAFRSVKVIKPKASRPRSREVYLLAQGLHGNGC